MPREPSSQPIKPEPVEDSITNSETVAARRLVLIERLAQLNLALLAVLKNQRYTIDDREFQRADMEEIRKMIAQDEALLYNIGPIRTQKVVIRYD